MKEYVFTTAGPFDEDKFLEGELAAFLQNYDKEYDDDAAVSDVAIHFYELGKKMKQKPAEWSNEDANALILLHELISFGYTERFFDAQTAEDMRRWLNERLKAHRPQPRKEQPEQIRTCKTCGFYENNCPFIRGKLIPYPNKVCKDYFKDEDGHE